VLINDIVIKFHRDLLRKECEEKTCGICWLHTRLSVQLWCRSRRNRRYCAPSVHHKKSKIAIANGQNACANTRGKKCRHSVLSERTWL